MPEDADHKIINHKILDQNHTSKEHSEGFIHKSYHILFIIYAPLALVSIALNILSDKYINYVFVTALLASCLSLILAIIMWILFWKHREIIEQERKAHIPYLIRHQFILLYLPIAFSSMGISAYYVYDKYVKTVENYHQTSATKVSILLPVTNQLGRKLEDSQQIKLAIGSFMLTQPELTSRYHLEVIDHNNHYNHKFEQQVVQHLRQGSDYFLCAYSDVCQKLAENIDSLSQRAELSSPPIIITTLSSSMELPLAKNQFYRLYVRNKEDTQVLAKYGFEQGKKVASFIATNDAYGKDAVQQFRNNWQSFGGVVQEGVYLDPLLTQDITKEKLLSGITTFDNAETIFIALYQDASDALATLSQEKMLLLSANYQTHLLEGLANQGLNENIIVSFPAYKTHTAQLENTAGTFIYLTLKKLINADLEAKEGIPFHEAWMSVDEPAFLKFEQDGVNDFNVAMKAMPYSDFKHMIPPTNTRK